MGIGKITEDVFLPVLPLGIMATAKSTKITYPHPKGVWYVLFGARKDSTNGTNNVSAHHHLASSAKLISGRLSRLKR
jgi:hypothetical protein